MAVQKTAPNTWRVKVSLWDKSKGYPISKQKTVTGTRADAIRAESNLLKELEARSMTSAHASTFGEAVVLYSQHLQMRGRLSPQHEKMIKFIHRELGHVRLEVFPEQFAVYRTHIARAPTAHGKARGAASINRYTGIVRAVFNHLVALEIIDRNPITSFRFPKLEERPRDRYPTQEERLRLLNAIDEHRPHILPIVLYMMLVPCRVGELVSAKREQYNPFTGTIYIPDSKAGIPIHKPVPAEMETYFKSIPEACPWLFYRKSVRLRKVSYHPLTHLRYAWQYCLKRAGLSDLRIHDLRHIAATDLYAVGNPERMIMDIAGWKTPMLSRYRHVDSLKSAREIRFGQPSESVPVELYKAGTQ